MHKMQQSVINTRKHSAVLRHDKEATLFRIFRRGLLSVYPEIKRIRYLK